MLERFPAILFASTLAVEKYQFAWYIIKHMIHKKKSILSIATLQDIGNYYQQNTEAEVRTRVVGGWLNVRTFADIEIHVTLDVHFIV